MTSNISSATASRAEARPVTGWLAWRLVRITAGETAAQLVRPAWLRPYASILAAAAVLALIGLLTHRAAATGQDLRLTGLAQVLAPIYGLAGGSVWSFVVLVRCLAAGTEVSRSRNRLALQPLTLRQIRALAYLPALLPLAVLSLAAAIPMVALVSAAGLAPTEALVPFLAGTALVGWSFLLASAACRLVARATSGDIGRPAVVGLLALAMTIGGYVHGLSPMLSTVGPAPGGTDPTGGAGVPDLATGAAASSPPVPWTNPIANVLDHTGPWPAWLVLVVLLLTVAPLLLLGHLSRTATGPGRGRHPGSGRDGGERPGTEARHA